MIVQLVNRREHEKMVGHRQHRRHRRQRFFSDQARQHDETQNEEDGQHEEEDGQLGNGDHGFEDNDLPDELIGLKVKILHTAQDYEDDSSNDEAKSQISFDGVSVDFEDLL